MLWNDCERLLHLSNLRLTKEAIVTQLAVSPNVACLTHITGMVAITVQKTAGAKRIVRCRTLTWETANRLSDVAIKTSFAQLAVVARGVPGTVQANSRVGVTLLGEGIALTE